MTPPSFLLQEHTSQLSRPGTAGAAEQGFRWTPTPYAWSFVIPRSRNRTRESAVGNGEGNPSSSAIVRKGRFQPQQPINPGGANALSCVLLDCHNAKRSLLFAPECIRRRYKEWRTASPAAGSRPSIPGRLGVGEAMRIWGSRPGPRPLA